MRIFIERQGRSGERKLTRVRNRFAGDHNHRGDRESRLSRLSAIQRDDRRLFGVGAVGLDLEDVGSGDTTMHACGTRQRYCHMTGVVIPVGGGAVRLDNDGGSRRRATLNYGSNGNLTSAHF